MKESLDDDLRTSVGLVKQLFEKVAEAKAEYAESIELSPEELRLGIRCIQYTMVRLIRSGGRFSYAA
jgi:hypothetical protein